MRQLTSIIMKAGDPVAKLSADWINTVSRRLDNIQILNGDVVIDGHRVLICPNTTTPESSGGAGDPTDPRAPGGTASVLGHIHAFESYANSAKNGIVMEPGDVMFEPGDNGVSPSEWLNWAGITNASTTPAVSSTDVCVWLSIDITALSAEMMVGTESEMKGYIAGLSEADKKHTTMRPLVKTEWADGVITRVKNLQCGDVIISRL